MVPFPNMKIVAIPQDESKIRTIKKTDAVERIGILLFMHLPPYGVGFFNLP
jgi:hypothetical protein